MKIISNYLQWSLPLKLVLSSLIFTIIGPGFFYFLTEYATYFYITSIGVRTPFEGVPYLSATVALLSVFLALCSALVFVVTMLIIGEISSQLIDIIRTISSIADKGLNEYRKNGGKFFHKLSFSNIVNSIENLSLKYIIALIFIFYILVFAVVNIIGKSPSDAKIIELVSIFYISIALFSLWSRAFCWVVTVLIVLLFYICSLNFLLDAERYKIFLQVVGYGGGIPIEVEYQGGSVIEPMNLIIRTSTSLIGEKNQVGDYVEIPMSNVKKIRYKKYNINSGKNN